MCIRDSRTAAGCLLQAGNRDDPRGSDRDRPLCVSGPVHAAGDFGDAAGLAGKAQRFGAFAVPRGLSDPVHLLLCRRRAVHAHRRRHRHRLCDCLLYTSRCV